MQFFLANALANILIEFLSQLIDMIRLDIQKRYALEISKFIRNSIE